GVLAVLAQMGSADGARLQALWDRYLAVRGEVRPADYEVCYPQALLDSLARHVIEGCRAVGLRDFLDTTPAGAPGPDIPHLLGAAWELFLRDADSYSSWEQARLAELWAMLGLNQP